MPLIEKVHGFCTLRHVGGGAVFLLFLLLRRGGIQLVLFRLQPEGILGCLLVPFPLPLSCTLLSLSALFISLSAAACSLESAASLICAFTTLDVSIVAPQRLSCIFVRSTHSGALPGPVRNLYVSRPCSSISFTGLFHIQWEERSQLGPPHRRQLLKLLAWRHLNVEVWLRVAPGIIHTFSDGFLSGSLWEY